MHSPTRLVPTPSCTRSALATPDTMFWSPEPAPTDAPVAACDEEEFGTRFRLPESRIEIDGVLGGGATAIVFRGEHVDLERPLAVKVLRDNVAWPGMRERFLNEARITSELNSPYVVDVVDFGELEDGRLWSAMELLDGSELADVIDGGPMSMSRAIALLRMACKGLHAAHVAGVVHRDVKPDNLMLVTRNGREHLVVVDFGLAAPGGPSDEACGTPRYMAPEQIHRLPLDCRTDIYALGCCAYEMVTGRFFARGRDIDDVLAVHLAGEPPEFPAEAEVPKALQGVITRCLAPNVEDRYPSAAALEAALIEAQLAANLRCSTDELEPPDVDPDHRRRLIRGLARPPREVRVRRLGAVLAGVLAFTAVGAVWANDQYVAQQTAAAADREAVHDLVVAARDAADHSRYVYPELEGDHGDTAYQRVLDLERWSGDAGPMARREASMLRDEFATHLERRARSLWDADARGDARELYAQALVFDPERAQARERVGMNEDNLRQLLEQAQRGEVSARAPLSEQVPPRPPETEEPEQPTPRRKAAGNPNPAPDPGLSAGARARHKVRDAQRAARSGSDTEARRLFEEAIDLDEGSARAHAGLAALHFDAGRHETALRHAKRAVRLAPRKAAYRVQLGDSYVRLNRRSEAKTQYGRAVAMGSGTAQRRLEVL